MSNKEYNLEKFKKDYERLTENLRKVRLKTKSISSIYFVDELLNNIEERYNKVLSAEPGTIFTSDDLTLLYDEEYEVLKQIHDKIGSEESCDEVLYVLFVCPAFALLILFLGMIFAGLINYIFFL